MIDRVKKITSQIRLYLKEVGTDELQNKEIFNKANYIQDEILRDTKCKQIEFNINLIADVDEYDIQLEDASMIKTHETSWGDILTYKQFNVLNEFSLTGNRYPSYFSLFDNKIYFRPKPLQTDDWVKIYAYQESVIIPMDDDIEPEIPKYADRCLIFGICAEYQPEKFYDRYVDEKNKVAMNAHNRIGRPKESECNW